MVSQTASDYTNDSSSEEESKKRLYLSGLSLNTDNEGLSAFFSRFGKIKDCHVVLSEEGHSRCCGFVNYEDVASVDECMRWRPHIIDGQQILTKRAMPNEFWNKSDSYLTVKKIFIGALRDGINEAVLREYFSRFGNVTDVVCIQDRFGQPRGFAYVSFDDYDAADKVIVEESHFVNGQRLNVEKAIPKQRLGRITTSYGSKTGPSSNNNNSGHINDKNSDNQVRNPSYNQQGYNSNRSNMDGDFSSSYNSMRQNQPPPLMKSMMNRNSYNWYQDMPFNNNVNLSSNSNSMQRSYEKNRQQYYDVIPNDFSGMNNRFYQPEIHKNSEGSNSSFSSNSFDNSNSYEATSHNYDTMPREQSRGGGPMHRGRGRGGGPFRGNKSSNYANRSAPYPTRGRSSNYNNRSAPYPTRGSSSYYNNRSVPYPTRDSSSNYRSRGRDQLNKK